MQKILELEKNIFLKSKLLVDGCDVSDLLILPDNFQEKKIHLYSHSTFKNNRPIPDDIVLGGDISACISRIRFNPHSKLKIILKNENYFLLNSENMTLTSVKFIPNDISGNIKLDDLNSVSSVCSFLGSDLLGIAPSNHCFYYRQKDECKFCEIWPTYKEEVEYLKPLKDPEIIKKAVSIVLQKDSNIKHIAVTSGNIKDYDFTAEYFCKIGDNLQKIPLFDKLQDILGTLMPPNNFNLIKKIKDSGFNKIYFPLEVFDKNLFKIICPGKYKYGYEKIIDALEFSVDIFGKGNVYTNFVYGIQSLNSNLDPKSYDPIAENEKSLLAVDQMLAKSIIPGFTIYHYSGHNKIGNISLSVDNTFDFFKKTGEKILNANLISREKFSIIFNHLSLSNTLYNDSFMLAKFKIGK